jgi:outer membrane protein assembly factor BamB
MGKLSGFAGLAMIAACAGCATETFRNPVDAGNGGKDDGFVFPDVDLAGGQICTPGSPPICDGTSIANCNVQGTGYDYTPCPAGCNNGVCTCNPGDVTCMNGDAYKCDNTGTYQLSMHCAMGMQCQNGSCADAKCADEVMSTNPHALPTNAWPRFRHDNRNTGATDAIVADNPKMLWVKGPYGTRTLNSQMGGMASGPVINQMNIVFVGAGDGDGQNGSLYALDNKTGNQLWAFAGNRGYGYTAPAVRLDGTSYFSSADGNAYAVDPNGKLVWKFPFGMQDDCSPVVTRDGIVIYGSDSFQLFALDFAGVKQWESDPQLGPGEVDAAVAESCDGLVLAGGTHGWSGIDAKTGTTMWEVPATGPYQALMSSPLVTADGTMFGIDSGGQAVAIDPKGKVLWQKVVGTAGAGTSLAKVGNQLFAVLNDGALHALDATNGNNNWTQSVGQVSEIYKHGGPVVDGKLRLYYNSNDGNVYSFDTTGKMLWKKPSSGAVAQGGNSFGEMAIGNDGTLYVPGNDGMLYAFK